MKNLLYLFFAITLMGCGDNQPEPECGCVKTSYHFFFRNSSSNSATTQVLGTENIPCQDSEGRVVTSRDSSGSNIYYYIICCDNIEDPNSGCD